MTDSTYATAPFDHPKADIILRSSDNINFRVFKLFLSLASTFFETLFEIPQPVDANEEQEVKDGLAVIPMTEDSKTLDTLLRFCYPCTLTSEPKLEVLKDAVEVIEAVRKYSLDAIERKACQAIMNPKISEAEPLQCFAIVNRSCLREATLLAAKNTLTQPLIPSWFQGIEMITAADLLALLIYHKKCGDAVYALRSDLSWITNHYESSEACAWLLGRYRSTGSSDVKYKNCSCPRASASRYTVFDSQPLRWWDDFMEQTFTELWNKPCKTTVQAAAEKTIQTVKARNCKSCSPTITGGMHEFSELFVGKVEEAVSRIELELNF